MIRFITVMSATVTVTVTVIVIVTVTVIVTTEKYQQRNKLFV